MSGYDESVENVLTDLSLGFDLGLPMDGSNNNLAMEGVLLASTRVLGEGITPEIDYEMLSTLGSNIAALVELGFVLDKSSDAGGSREAEPQFLYDIGMASSRVGVAGAPLQVLTDGDRNAVAFQKVIGGRLAISTAQTDEFPLPVGTIFDNHGPLSWDKVIPNFPNVRISQVSEPDAITVVRPSVFSIPPSERAGYIPQYVDPQFRHQAKLVSTYNIQDMHDLTQEMVDV